ncbi:hypothetical protein ACFSQ7_27350 [Paenibacillus rhizoplanae]
MSQELAYLYGRTDLWEEDPADSEHVTRELTLYLGVMFGVAGSASMMRMLTARISQQLLKKLPQQALTQTMYYPILKKISAYIGIKITKNLRSRCIKVRTGPRRAPLGRNDLFLDETNG